MVRVLKLIGLARMALLGGFHVHCRPTKFPALKACVPGVKTMGVTNEERGLSLTEF